VRRRIAAVVLLIAVAVGAAYYFLIRDEGVTPAVEAPKPAATIGSGSDAVAVSSTGAVIPWFKVSEAHPLPTLSLEKPPKGGQLAGPALEQVRVLGAVPPALQPYLRSSSYGESGVEVELSTGIELRFGDSSQIARKWKAVAAVLADPTITLLDYVDVQAPGHPAVGGSGHELPPAP
jgi:cell division protein FtsQ